jgi:hypothetical protein
LKLAIRRKSTGLTHSGCVFLIALPMFFVAGQAFGGTDPSPNQEIAANTIAIPVGSSSSETKCAPRERAAVAEPELKNSVAAPRNDVKFTDDKPAAASSLTTQVVPAEELQEKEKVDSQDSNSSLAKDKLQLSITPQTDGLEAAPICKPE